ncbi:hypothetical protein BH11BAC2_BH11BAC2_14080 [soil metagenome]
MKLLKYICTFIFLLFSVVLNAQSVEMADRFRADGKIYVVVFVAAIVITFIAVYMVRLDFKVSRLEKMIKEKKH